MRIVIFANGILSHPNFLKKQLRPTDQIYCADGGTHHALSLNLTPHAIIGDLDSLSPEILLQMEAAGVTFHRHPVDKDETDLELALELAVSKEPEEIVLVSTLGGRLDQMLGNILLLTRPEYKVVRISLIEGPQRATVLHNHQMLTIQGQPGDTLSLIPLTPTVENVDISGVKWPLSKATLTFGSTFTLSNTLTTSQAVVQIGQGMVLVIHFDATTEETLRNEGSL